MDLYYAKHMMEDKHIFKEQNFADWEKQAESKLPIITTG